MLKKCIRDHSLVLPIEEIKVTASLSHEEEPIAILDLQVRKLRMHRGEVQIDNRQIPVGIRNGGASRRHSISHSSTSSGPPRLWRITVAPKIGFLSSNSSSIYESLRVLRLNLGVQKGSRFVRQSCTRGTETTIDWPTRMRIDISITKGISFLHTKENIIHGNLTSRNILLDEKNNPKIADVGLSRLMTTAGNTNVIATAGTLGYHAPELSKIKNASTKTDVYSLGVIILELLTGKSPSEAMDYLDLPQWVASIVKEEWTNEVFDVELMRDTPNIGGEFLNTLKWLCTVSIPHQLLDQKLRKYYRNWRR
ncbi:hypothetical protein BC332_20073 [Capsicum chinense]|nr:hypothetical protein BC332_20073 [Capsicum chinense]